MKFKDNKGWTKVDDNTYEFHYTVTDMVRVGDVYFIPRGTGYMPYSLDAQIHSFTKYSDPKVEAYKDALQELDVRYNTGEPWVCFHSVQDVNPTIEFYYLPISIFGHWAEFMPEGSPYAK